MEITNYEIFYYAISSNLSPQFGSKFLLDVCSHTLQVYVLPLTFSRLMTYNYVVPHR